MRAAVLAGLLGAIGCAASAGAEPFLLAAPGGDGPTPVSVGFFLQRVSEIDDQRETVEFEATLTLRWKDERQAFDSIAAGTREKYFQGDYEFDEVFTGWWPQLVLSNGSGSAQGIALRVQSDGSLTLTQEINAVAKIRLDLRRFPFDRQELPILFHVIGASQDVVVLREDAAATGRNPEGVSPSGWHLTQLRAHVRSHALETQEGHTEPVSQYVATLSMSRRPSFTLRQIVFPLIVLVALTWSVFWMDRQSVGDRMAISFVGMLSVITYQLVIQESMPKIAYTTLTHVFLTTTYVLVAASAVINLVVESRDRRGQTERADRIDRTCRWAFPGTFFGLNALVLVYFLLIP